MFGKASNGLYGRKSRCLECVRLYEKTYQKTRYATDASFREKIKLRSKVWVKNNPEKRAIIAKKRNMKALQNSPEAVRCRALVNQRVRFKRMPRASSLLCSVCGNKAAHYHHHKGYSFQHRYDVIPVCIPCHKAQDALVNSMCMASLPQKAPAARAPSLANSSITSNGIVARTGQTV